MVISGSLALVDRGVLKHDEAVIHYRLERADENYICHFCYPIAVFRPLCHR